MARVGTPMNHVEPAGSVALLYRRVSTDEQAQDGISLAAQQRQTRAYAAMHMWTVAGEFVDVLSGTRDDRPGYVRMLTRARRHLSRSAR